MIKSLSFQIRGTVQGVGFRPWVYGLAHQLHIKGFVRNTSQGVAMEIEGQENEVANFVRTVRTQPPAHCVITQCLQTDILPKGYEQFRIISSQDDHQHEAMVLPDIATCPDCVREIFDRSDRRFLYPFTNCTHCGPRYSIVEGLPYDRKNTSMKKFKMCPQCRKEYNDPANRRFHAQPNACPVCGPKVELWDEKGLRIATSGESLAAGAGLIKQGAIVAVKALGGFYLMADASNNDAVSELRKRKARPHKPFAVMMPSLEMLSHYCMVDSQEAKLLQSSQAPIVLLSEKPNGLKVSHQVAPDNPYLGCMLPSMPLLHILMRLIKKPVVATSGNLNEEPICIDNHEALDRLKGIADFFLVHDRPIVRHVDDSVARIVCAQPFLIRRARGYAPFPVDIGINCDGLLATGALQKNTVAVGLGASVIISQHIGDLDNQVSALTFEKTISSLKSIYDAPVTKVICDSHPDYTSSRYALKLAGNVMKVQHHHAHMASCMAEKGITKEVLGVCWDGTGYGDDGTVWGGEFLLSHGGDFRRFAHLKTFALPGGEMAVKQPRRSALGLLFGFCEGDWQGYKDLPCVKAFSAQELPVIQRMITQKLNSPQTSSMGRLFDGLASLTGLCHQASFEGQAAMALEFRISDKGVVAPYSYQVLSEDHKESALIIDWTGIVKGAIEDIRAGGGSSLVSTRFHYTLIEIIADVARRSGRGDIVLTGGCFQNKWLLEKAVDRLRKEGFNPYWQSMVPVNDGGISLGQMYVAARRLEDVSGNTGKN